MRAISSMLLIASLTMPAAAELKTQAVEYQHGETKLKGYLVFDDAAEGKRPGVVVFHEWWGLNDYARHRAEQLARLGYVALAADLYGEGKTTRDPKQAGEWAGALRKDAPHARARATAALKVLREHERVDPARLAAIGYCLGGSMALELARSGADLAAAVSFHGSLKTASPAAPGSIKAAILVCNGGDDAFVSDAEIATFKEEMRAANADWQLNTYGGAYHSFTNPDADQAGIKGVSYNAEADRRSWDAMRRLFEEVLR